DPEAPKKPVGGAYGIFLADNREAIKKSLPADAKITDVTKEAGKQWAVLSEEAKKPFQDRYIEKSEVYKKESEEYKKTHVADDDEEPAKGGKKAKKEKDPDAPKKPAGGAYAVYLADNREKINKSLPEGHKMTDVAKEAGRQWKELSEEARKPFQDRYLEKSEVYKKAKEEYMKKTGKTGDDEEEEEEGVEETSPAKKQKASPKKRAAPASTEAPAAKRGRPGAKASAAPEAPEIDSSVMTEATGLNLHVALKNLAARPDVLSSGKSHKELLEALKGNNGLVNKAKASLLGA
ncbi:unnamed protein product, partial [Polarella glacialis]